MCEAVPWEGGTMARGKAGSRDPERSRRWTSLVSEWRASGVSQAAFCRERGLNANSFNFWKLRMLRQRPGTRRARGALEATTGAGASAFIPVRIAAPVACALDVCLRSGHTIRIAADFDETVLRRLIRVLEPDGEAGRAC
jgi:hypothetical protein